MIKPASVFATWLFAVGSGYAALAQPEDSTFFCHAVGLQFGGNQIKEENLHAKVHSGTLTMLGYGFEKKHVVWHQFHFALGYSRLKTNFEDVSKSANLSLSADYSWNYPLVNRRFTYYLGPEGSIVYNASYLPNWDDSHLYWADYYSIGVRNSFSIPLKNQNEWVAFVSFPLFSVFSRPDLYRLYKIDDTDFDGIVRNLNSNLTTAHLTNVFYLKFQTEYRTPIFEHQRQAFTFSIGYQRVKHDDGNRFSQLTYQVGLKFLL